MFMLKLEDLNIQVFEATPLNQPFSYAQVEEFYAQIVE